MKTIEHAWAALPNELTTVIKRELEERVMRGSIPTALNFYPTEVHTCDTFKDTWTVCLKNQDGVTHAEVRVQLDPRRQQYTASLTECHVDFSWDRDRPHKYYVNREEWRDIQQTLNPCREIRIPSGRTSCASPPIATLHPDLQAHVPEGWVPRAVKYARWCKSVVIMVKHWYDTAEVKRIAVPCTRLQAVAWGVVPDPYLAGTNYGREGRKPDGSIGISSNMHKVAGVGVSAPKPEPLACDDQYGEEFEQW